MADTRFVMDGRTDGRAGRQMNGRCYFNMPSEVPSGAQKCYFEGDEIPF